MIAVGSSVEGVAYSLRVRLSAMAASYQKVKKNKKKSIRGNKDKRKVNTERKPNRHQS